MTKDNLRVLVDRVTKFNLQLEVLLMEYRKTIKMIDILSKNNDDPDIPMMYDWLSKVSKKISDHYKEFLK